MPQLRQKQIIRVELPSYENEQDKAYVELETPLQMSDYENLELVGNESQTRQSAMVVATKIKSWNLTDAEGKTLEVNADNVLALDAADFGTLTIELGLDKIMQRLSRAKKKSSSST